MLTFGTLDAHLAHCVFIWYIFSCFGVMHQEKSGNTGTQYLYCLSHLHNGIRLGFDLTLEPVGATPRPSDFRTDKDFQHFRFV
jgi:hypothetical protein